MEKTRGRKRPLALSTVEARAAIVVNFLLASWRIREAAEREPEPDRGRLIVFPR
jgi:hypothetical protein